MSNRVSAKRVDPKAKRQKVTVAVGTVVLAVVLAIQVPKLLRLSSPSSDTAIAAPSRPAGGAPEGEATVSSATSAEAPAPSGPSEAAAADAQPQAGYLDSGDLDSFGRFRSKDPFAPQLSPASRAAQTDPGRTSAPTASSPKGSTAGESSSEHGTAALPSGGTISVNGVSEQVAVGAPFPRGEGAFKLIALTASTAKIGLVSGSYVGGASAITLRRGKTVTLMNTATGARYRLLLVSISDA
jgi:hypothetical protein